MAVGRRIGHSLDQHGIPYVVAEQNRELVERLRARGVAAVAGDADIVFHDALVEAQMLELCPQAIKVAVGKRCGKLSSAQHFINKRLVDAAKQYKTIVRLKGGDPMIFGRADEEITELEEHCAIPNEGVQLGVIAQELQAVLPECVKEESTGVLTVDTSNLTWYLVNAVKELNAKVTALEAQLGAK